ncbi:hypothetical protein BXZ70DRAFT_470397 [Cristinia sonorae]|uniref:Uncharacterized protein n=1 Tax=Cristinia sonorae TaxID=1940300 RepID=A0A8K0UIF7_9AGAR|nr:hypothetical protein BXZ70DRAFT_470397 [Cristinia sonorae]
MEPIKPCLLRLPALLGLLLRQISRATHWLYSIAHGSNRHTGINLECASWRNTRLSIIEVILAGRCDAGELLRLMRAVDGRLSTIAGSGYFNSELQVLQTEWKDFADLVWDSRELAGEAQAIASDFLQVFLQRLEDHAIPFDDKLLELRDYLKFEKQAVKPKRIASAFGTLTQRLDLYIKKCSTLLVESHHTHHHSEIVTIVCTVLLSLTTAATSLSLLSLIKSATYSERARSALTKGVYYSLSLASPQAFVSKANLYRGIFSATTWKVRGVQLS